MGEGSPQPIRLIQVPVIVTIICGDVALQEIGGALGNGVAGCERSARDEPAPPIAAGGMVRESVAGSRAVPAGLPDEV
jgi:hypothetical protein